MKKASQPFTWLRTHWIAILVATIAAFALLRGAPLWAATAPREIRQTVPPPTIVPTDTPLPPATATPEPPPPPPPPPTQPPPPDNNNGGNPPAPTDTPPVQPTAAPVTITSCGGAITTQLIGEVATDALNVRRGPGRTFQVIAALKRGQLVEVLQRDPANTWWKICTLPSIVTSNSITGWVSAQFIAPQFDSKQAPQLIPIATEIPAVPVNTNTPTIIPTTAPTTAAPTIVPTNTVAPTNTITPTKAAQTQPTPTGVAGSAPPTATQAAMAGYAIDLKMTHSPPFPLQGDEVVLEFTVSNPGAQAATVIELRDELPEGLIFVAGTAADNGELIQNTTAAGRSVFSFVWDKLPARASTTARVTLRIADDLPNGAVLDNLAYAGALNFPGTTAGVSLGMPPAALPDFQ